jgi:anthranilate synthase component 1
MSRGASSPFHPSAAEVHKIASTGQYTTIPVYKELTADLETPVSAFLKVRRAQHSFLLESVEGGEFVARYSFIGTEPSSVLTSSTVFVVGLKVLTVFVVQMAKIH